MWTIFVNLLRLGGMQMVIALTAIVRNKVLATRLGVDGYGEFSQIALLAVSASALVAFGLGMSLRRNVAAAREPAEKQRMLGQANAIVLAISAVCLGIAIPLLLVNPGVLAMVGLTPRPEIVAAALIVCAYIPVEAAVQHRVAFLTVLDIKGLTGWRSVALIVGTVMSVPIVWYFGLLGAAVQLVLLGLTIMILLDRRCRKIGYRPWSITFDGRVARLLFAFGLASLAVNIVYQATEVAVRSMLLRSHGAAENGLYGAALAIVGQINAIVLGSVASYSTVMMSQDSSRDNITGVADRLLAVVLPVAVAGFAMLGLLSGPVLLLLFSAEFLPAQKVLAILLTAEVMQVANWVLNAPLLALRRVKTWLVLSAASEIVRLALAYLLIPHYGAEGIAIAYLVVTMLYLAVTIWYFVILGHAIAPRNVVAMVLGTVFAAVMALAGSQGLLDLGAYAIGIVVVGLAGIAFVHLSVGVPTVLARLRAAVGLGGEH